jgi:hypothetical protein
MLLILARMAGVFISATPCTAPPPIVVVVNINGGSCGFINDEVVFRDW